MLREFFKSLEDLQRPLLGPNIWILKKIGLILSNNQGNKAIYIFLHELVTFFVFTQFMELYVIRSDLDEALANLRISMLSVICIVKSNTFIFWQKHWLQVINYASEADREEREIENKTKGIIIESYTKYCRKITYFYWVLVCTTFITVVNTPLLRYLSSTNFREGLHNGTELFPHIFSSWMPIDKNKSPGCWITIVWHTGLCAYGAMIMAAYDTSAMVMMVFFGGKLDLLRERFKQMLGTLGACVSNRESDMVIRQLHDTYLQLTKHSRLFNSLLSPVMFLYVVICSLMICASAYLLTTASNTTHKLMMAEYLIFGIIQLFLFCWHSNNVLIKSGNLTCGPYESNWSSASLEQKKNVVIFMGQLRVKYIYTAGPFTNLTLSTFITIIKGAYSYYTLLRE